MVRLLPPCVLSPPRYEMGSLAFRSRLSRLGALVRPVLSPRFKN